MNSALGGQYRELISYFVEAPRLAIGLILETDSGVDEGFHHSEHGACAVVSGNIGVGGELLSGAESAEFLASRAARDLSCPGELNGLFVAAVWQAQRERLVLFGDWIGGIHQLFYADLPDCFIFSTDPRMLIECGLWEGDVDPQALAHYLDFGRSMPPRTLFGGIQKLPGGCQLTYHEKTVEVKRYEQVGFGRGTIEGEPARQLRDIHRAAVERCMRSAEDMGAFLSGGLDSGLNVAAMSELSSRPVKTFSLVYPGEEIDESSYSRLLAECFGTEHYELRIESAAVLDELPEMVWALEEPAMDYSFVPTFNLARFARQHVPAVVSGDGPDHLFGRHYPVALIRSTLGRLPGIRSLASRLIPDCRSARPRASAIWRTVRRANVGRLMWKTLESLTGNVEHAYLSIYREIACRGLLPDGPRTLLRDAAAIPACSMCFDNPLHGITESGRDDFDRITCLDLTVDGSSGVFAKVGKMASYHDLAVYEPYLDAQVRDLVHALPDSLKVRGSLLDLPGNRLQRKVLLYEAARGVLPDEVLEKPKQGFRAPIADWLCEWIEGLDAHHLLPALTGEIELVDAERVTDLLREHLSGERTHETLIMMLITLDLWYAIFVLGKARKPDWRWSDYLQRAPLMGA